MIYARKIITTLLPFRKFFSIFGNLIGESESDGLPANDCDDYSADEDHVDIHQVTRLLEGDSANFKTCASNVLRACALNQLRSKRRVE